MIFYDASPRKNHKHLNTLFSVIIIEAVTRTIILHTELGKVLYESNILDITFVENNPKYT